MEIYDDDHQRAKQELAFWVLRVAAKLGEKVPGPAAKLVEWAAKAAAYGKDPRGPAHVMDVANARFAQMKELGVNFRDLLPERPHPSVLELEAKTAATQVGNPDRIAEVQAIHKLSYPAHQLGKKALDLGKEGLGVEIDPSELQKPKVNLSKDTPAAQREPHTRGFDSSQLRGQSREL